MSEALERKLRPLYDAIDSRNFKQALKLAAAALQKYPNNQLVRALKSVALQRSGKDEEALELTEEIAKETPVDEQVLYTLTLTWQAAGKMKSITAAYEAASNLDPKNKTFAEQVFGGYVREGNLVKQQQAAMKLYRLDQSEKQLLWVVTTLLVQGKAGGSDAAKLLTLAEAMLKKCIDAGGLSTQESLFIYLRILHEQGKHAAALETVKGPLAARCLSLKSDAQRLEGDLAVKAGDWTAAATAQQALLKDNPDDWLALVAAVDALLACHGAGLPATAAAAGGAEAGAPPQLPELLQRIRADPAQAEAAFAKVDEFVSALVADADGRGGSHVVGRGPYLALVEVALRRVETPGAWGAAEVSRALAEGVLAYWRKLGDMVSCCADLRAYTRRLTRGDAEEARIWLCERLREGAAEEEKKMDEAVGASGDGSGLGDAERKAHAKAVARSLFRFGAAQALLADLGSYSRLSLDAAEKCAAALLRVARSTLFVNFGADKREHTPSDVVFLLAAEALVSAGQAQTDPSVAVRGLLGASAALHEGLQNSPHNAPLLLALTSTYGLLCAGSAAFEVWATLEAKHIQWDTLSHHLFPILLTCGPHGEALRALRATRKLHLDHSRDSGDMVLLAFQNGTFDKAVEFVGFRDRLAASLTFAAASAELAVLTGLHALPAVPVGKAAAGAPPVSLALLEPGEAQAKAAALATALIPALSAASLEALRFNWDLATQPAFASAPETSYGAAVPEWWARSGSERGGRRAEWAPEGEGGSAARRDSLRAALVTRMATAQLAAAVGTGMTADGAPGCSSASARACLARLDAAGRGDWRAAVAAPDGGANGSGSADASPASGKGHLNPLAAAAFAALTAALEVQSTEAEGSTDAGAPAKEAVAKLTEWAAGLEAAATTSAAAIAAASNATSDKDGGLPLSGGVLAAASPLLFESLPLALAMARGYIPAVAPSAQKQGGKGKGGKGAAGAARDKSGDAALAEALRGLAAATKRAAQALEAPVLASLGPTEAEQVALVTTLTTSSEMMGVPGSSAIAIAEKIVQGQRAALGQLQRQIAAISLASG